jgi:hypothetical protein
MIGVEINVTISLHRGQVVLRHKKRGDHDFSNTFGVPPVEGMTEADRKYVLEKLPAWILERFRKDVDDAVLYAQTPEAKP